MSGGEELRMYSTEYNTSGRGLAVPGIPTWHGKMKGMAKWVADLFLPPLERRTGVSPVQTDRRDPSLSLLRQWGWVGPSAGVQVSGPGVRGVGVRWGGALDQLRNLGRVMNLGSVFPSVK